MYTNTRKCYILDGQPAVQQTNTAKIITMYYIHSGQPKIRHIQQMLYNHERNKSEKNNAQAHQIFYFWYNLHQACTLSTILFWKTNEFKSM